MINELSVSDSVDHVVEPPEVPNEMLVLFNSGFDYDLVGFDVLNVGSHGLIELQVLKGPHLHDVLMAALTLLDLGVPLPAFFEFYLFQNVPFVPDVLHFLPELLNLEK